MFKGNAYSDDGQRFMFSEATKLACNGDEFSHLICLLTPDYALRLKAFVAELPDSVRNKTIYGKAISRSIPATAKAKRAGK